MPLNFLTFPFFPRSVDTDMQTTDSEQLMDYPSFNRNSLIPPSLSSEFRVSEFQTSGFRKQAQTAQKSHSHKTSKEN